MYLLGIKTGKLGGLRSPRRAGTWPPFLHAVWERGRRKKGLATAGLAVSFGPAWEEVAGRQQEALFCTHQLCWVPGSVVPQPHPHQAMGKALDP